MEKSLQDVVKESLHFVACHPQHDLNLGYRQAIWTALDYNSSRGHERRTLLAYLTASHTLPIWAREFPNDYTPRVLLENAQKPIQGKINKMKASENCAEFLVVLNGLGYAKDNMAFTAGYAAVQAVYTATDDENFDPDNIDYNIIDNQDCEGADASFFAACAYANGPVWKQQSNIKNRQNFWNWWLKSAVLQAVI